MDAPPGLRSAAFPLELPWRLIHMYSIQGDTVLDPFAGTGTAGTGGDGGAATAAQLRGPRDVAMGPDGEIYIADTDNHCVRVVGTDGAMETFAGQCGVPGYEGDQGLAADALLQRPFGVEVGPDGTVYIADTYNNVLRMVHR